MAMNVGQTGRCDGCDAMIFWVRNHKGNRMPIDRNPVANGNLILVRPGYVRYLTKADAGYPGDRYVSHHASCPDAAKFRKSR